MSLPSIDEFINKYSGQPLMDAEHQSIASYAQLDKRLAHLEEENKVLRRLLSDQWLRVDTLKNRLDCASRDYSDIKGLMVVLAVTMMVLGLLLLMTLGGVA